MDQWMELDDLDGGQCSFSNKQPCFPACETHLVMWEKVLQKYEDVPSKTTIRESSSTGQPVQDPLQNKVPNVTITALQDGRKNKLPKNEASSSSVIVATEQLKVPFCGENCAIPYTDFRTENLTPTASERMTFTGSQSPMKTIVVQAAGNVIDLRNAVIKPTGKRQLIKLVVKKKSEISEKMVMSPCVSKNSLVGQSGNRMASSGSQMNSVSAAVVSKPVNHVASNDNGLVNQMASNGGLCAYLAASYDNQPVSQMAPNDNRLSSQRLSSVNQPTYQVAANDNQENQFISNDNQPDSEIVNELAGQMASSENQPANQMTLNDSQNTNKFDSVEKSTANTTLIALSSANEHTNNQAMVCQGDITTNPDQQTFVSVSSTQCNDANMNMCDNNTTYSTSDYYGDAANLDSISNLVSYLGSRSGSDNSGQSITNADINYTLTHPHNVDEFESFTKLLCDDYDPTQAGRMVVTGPTDRIDKTSSTTLNDSAQNTATVNASLPAGGNKLLDSCEETVNQTNSTGEKCTQQNIKHIAETVSNDVIAGLDDLSNDLATKKKPSPVKRCTRRKRDDLLFMDLTALMSPSRVIKSPEKTKRTRTKAQERKRPVKTTLSTSQITQYKLTESSATSIASVEPGIESHRLRKPSIKRTAENTSTTKAKKPKSDTQHLPSIDLNKQNGNVLNTNKICPETVHFATKASLDNVKSKQKTGVMVAAPKTVVTGDGKPMIFNYKQLVESLKTKRVSDKEQLDLLRQKLSQSYNVQAPQSAASKQLNHGFNVSGIPLKNTPMTKKFNSMADTVSHSMLPSKSSSDSVLTSQSTSSQQYASYCPKRLQAKQAKSPGKRKSVGFAHFTLSPRKRTPKKSRKISFAEGPATDLEARHCEFQARRNLTDFVLGKSCADVSDERRVVNSQTGSDKGYGDGFSTISYDNSTSNENSGTNVVLSDDRGVNISDVIASSLDELYEDKFIATMGELCQTLEIPSVISANQLQRGAESIAKHSAATTNAKDSPGSRSVKDSPGAVLNGDDFDLASFLFDS